MRDGGYSTTDETPLSSHCVWSVKSVSTLKLLFSMEVKVEYPFGLRTQVPFIHTQLFKKEGIVEPNKRNIYLYLSKDHCLL